MEIHYKIFLPEGPGSVNCAGINYYKQLILLLRENDIVPNATMYRWDLSYALQSKDGSSDLPEDIRIGIENTKPYLQELPG